MTPGKFHRPKPNPGPNAFESAQGSERSALLAADPSYFKASKRGTAQAVDSPSHIKIIGQRTRHGMSPGYNQVLTYSKAGAA